MRIDYSLFEDKYYQMDPRTEDLLYDGSGLIEGMVVLIESPDQRVDVDEELIGVRLERAMRYNRWALVTHIELNEALVEFIAVYQDGSKKKISVDRSWGWYFKISQLDVELEDEADIRASEMLEPKVVGTAKVVEDLSTGGVHIDFEVDAPKAWTTPPFERGDGDLDPMPQRQPGLLFDEMLKARQAAAEEAKY